MTTLSQTKIKVSRSLLIARLKEVLAQGDDGYTKMVVARERAIEKAKKELRAQIVALDHGPELRIDDAVKAAKGRYSSHVVINITSDTEIPPEPKDTACTLRNTIAVLEMSEELSIPLTADQYSDYFPCQA